MTAVGLGKGPVFREEGGHHHDLGVLLRQQGLDHGDQPRGRAAGEKQVPGLQVRAEPAVQVGGDGLPCAVKAAGHGIAVDLDGIGVVENIVNGLVDLGRGGDAGVSQGIIEHVLRAHRFGLLQAIGEQLPDDGGRGAQLIEFLVYHNILSSMYAVWSGQVHPPGQDAAGGDGSQLGIGAVGPGHQHDGHLGPQDDPGVLGPAE